MSLFQRSRLAFKSLSSSTTTAISSSSSKRFFHTGRQQLFARFAVSAMHHRSRLMMLSPIILGGMASYLYLQQEQENSLLVHADSNSSSTNYQNYLNQVKKTKKAMVIKNPSEFYEMYRNKDADIYLDVYTTWCKYCVIMAEEYDKLATVLAENDVDNCLIVKWDKDQFKPPVEARSVPTIIFIAAGEEVGDDHRLYHFNRERTAKEFAQFIVAAGGKSAKKVKRLLDEGKFD